MAWSKTLANSGTSFTSAETRPAILGGVSPSAKYTVASPLKAASNKLPFADKSLPFTVSFVPS